MPILNLFGVLSVTAFAYIFSACFLPVLSLCKLVLGLFATCFVLILCFFPFLSSSYLLFRVFIDFMRVFGLVSGS